MDLEYGPWIGGKHAGSFMETTAGVTLVFHSGRISKWVAFSDRVHGSRKAAMAAAVAKQKEVSLAARLTKNLYRRVRNASTGQEWYEMILTRKKTLLFVDKYLDVAKNNTWCASKRGRTWYAMSQVDGVKVYFHRLATGYAYVDHINLDGFGLCSPPPFSSLSLDCREPNLRECTHQENMREHRVPANNTSGVVGVSFATSTQTWYACWHESSSYCRKGFGVSKHGMEGAFQLAIECRHKMERKFGIKIRTAIWRAFGPEDDSGLDPLPPGNDQIVADFLRRRRVDNKSGITGVSFEKGSGRWVAQCLRRGRAKRFLVREYGDLLAKQLAVAYRWKKEKELQMVVEHPDDGIEWPDWETLMVQLAQLGLPLPDVGDEQPAALLPDPDEGDEVVARAPSTGVDKGKTPQLKRPRDGDAGDGADEDDGTSPPAAKRPHF